MSKFKVGDVVIGNENASRYHYTKQGCVCIVNCVDSEKGGIIVYLAKQAEDGVTYVPLSDQDYFVSETCFDLHSKPMPTGCKFKIGDVVIGNDLAEKHHSITKQGWIGIVRDIVHKDLIKVSSVEIDRGTVIPNSDDTFSVDPNYFDYLDYKPRTMPVIKTKEGLLDDLSRQRDCYYSLSQVVDMINNLEDSQPVTPGKILVDQAQIDLFLDEVRERLEDNFSGSGINDRFIDTDSAEFSINGNCIELDSVDLDSDEVVDTTMECLENVLYRHVICLEKSDALES